MLGTVIMVRGPKFFYGSPGHTLQFLVLFWGGVSGQQVGPSMVLSPLLLQWFDPPDGGPERATGEDPCLYNIVRGAKVSAGGPDAVHAEYRADSYMGHYRCCLQPECCWRE